MKLKDGLLMREVAGNHVVVPTGSSALDFSGMITLNEAGAYLWKLLAAGATEEELVSGLLEEYDTEESTAQADVSQFLEKLRAAELLVP